MFMGVLSSHWTYEEGKECRTIMLVRAVDHREPGLTPVPSRKNTKTPTSVQSLLLLLRLVWIEYRQLALRGSSWGTNIQRMVSLHQVQRVRVQYFSHSNNIQQTVQVGARLANGTHQQGTCSHTIVHVEYNHKGTAKMTMDRLRNSAKQEHSSAQAIKCITQGTNCSSLHLLAQFLQIS